MGIRWKIFRKIDLRKISELIESGNFYDAAIRVTRLIEDKYYRSKALSQIASELAKIDADRDKELFDRVLEVAEGIKDDLDRPFIFIFNYRSEALSQIAAELAKIDADKALEVAEGIEDDYYKSKALSQIAAELAKIDADKAAKLFDKALEVAEGIEKDDYDRSKALVAIAAELAKIDADKAAKIAEKIEWDYYKSEALSQIASELAKIDAEKAAKLFDRALEIAEGIKNDYYKSEALSQIASELAKAHITNILSKKAREYENKDVRKAIELYESIGDERAKELKRLLKFVKSDKPVTLEQLEQIRREKIETARKVKELITKYGAGEEIKRELERFERGDYSVDVDKLYEEMKTREKVENLIKNHNHVIFPPMESLTESERLKVVEETISKYERAKEELNRLKNNPFSGYLESELNRIENLFKEGKYDEVLEEAKVAREKVEEIKTYLKKLEEVKSKIGAGKETIPVNIWRIINTEVKTVEELKEKIEKLEKEINSVFGSKPKLEIEIIDKEINTGWNEFKVKITNKGYADAYDVKISLNGDVNFLEVNPTVINGLESKIVQIPIKPLESGKYQWRLL